VSVGSLRWGKNVENLKEGASIIMPLLEWDDADVYHYLAHRQTLPDLERYEVIDESFRSKKDLKANPDHAPYCIRCLVAKKGSAVPCPLTKSDVVTFATISGSPKIRTDHVDPIVLC
jgi:hypothetical protein